MTFRLTGLGLVIWRRLKRNRLTPELTDQQAYRNQYKPSAELKNNEYKYFLYLTLYFFILVPQSIQKWLFLPEQVKFNFQTEQLKKFNLFNLSKGRDFLMFPFKNELQLISRETLKNCTTIVPIFLSLLIDCVSKFIWWQGEDEEGRPPQANCDLLTRYLESLGTRSIRSRDDRYFINIKMDC